jgi:hypothetical protein
MPDGECQLHRHWVVIKRVTLEPKLQLMEAKSLAGYAFWQRAFQ